MAYNSFKRLGVEVYDMVYTKQGVMDFFSKVLNFSGSGGVEDIILKSCYADEKDHMAPSDEFERDFFYMYLM